MPNNTTFVFNISSAADFNTDMALIDVGGTDAGTGDTYDFNIVSGFTLDRQLDAVNLQGGTSGNDVLNITGATAPGGTVTLNGANTYNGFFVYAGNVNISDVTLNQMKAVGGAGGSGADGGGGGLGAGGALFVASGGKVALANVALSYNNATGGAGGVRTGALQGGGGGGGLGGAGGSGGFDGSGGGGVGKNATGGNGSYYSAPSGFQGIILGAGSGGAGARVNPVRAGGSGGSAGGGGGSGAPAGGGGVGGQAGISAGSHGYAGGNGGFGGGGGGAEPSGTGYAEGGDGGFGGGGGGGNYLGGLGGFGGGGAGGGHRGGLAGFGGKPGGGSYNHNGGGGAGMGGAIFVQAGGSISFQGSLTLDGNTTAGGSGNGGTASHFGDGIFLQGNQGGSIFTFDPQAGQTETFDNSIADQSAGGGGGSWSLTKTGDGTLVLGAANSFSGGITLTAGTLELAAAGAAGSGAITFENSQVDPTLEFTLADAPTNAIDGFAAGDNIQIDGFTEQSGTYWNNTLTLHGTDGSGGSATVTLDVPNELPSNFAVAVAGDTTTISFGQNETDIVACYRRGTSVEVARGRQQNVEDLKIGDKVRTASGALRPIKWIGRRSYAGRFVMARKDILPVCFKAGALGDSMPERDLWISPNHAMYFKDERGGVLVEAKDLVNGASIVQAERVEQLEYFHIELETHDVIVAEGALSETFIDDDSRGMFHNAHDYDTLYAEEVRRPACYCAPRLDEGYQLEAVRQRLAQRAGLLCSADAPRTGAVRGYIDRVRTSRIVGWAQNSEAPEVPVCVDIYADGKFVGRVLANAHRDDLKAAGLGSGRHGFEFAAPAGVVFAPDTVDVRRSLDGEPLLPSANAKRAPASTAA